MFRNFDLILLRHAEAQHNMIKKQIREKRNLKKGDQVSELKELRLNQNFRD
jgi:ribosomal protein L35